MKTPKLQLKKFKKIRHKLYASLSGGLVLSQILMGVTYYSGPGITSETPEAMSKNIITYTNEERIKAGGTTLTENTQLDEAAKLKLEDMFANNYWEHVAPTSGLQAWDFMKESGYTYQYAGENLAKGYHDSSSTVNAWMNSQTHKDNLLNQNYTDIGVAVGSGTLDGKPVTLVVQLFGKPATSNIASTPATTSVLGVKQNASLSLLTPVAQSRIPYFIAWLILFILIIFDGIEVRRLKLHKSKSHMFEFRSALLINTLAFILLFVTLAAVA